MTKWLPTAAVPKPEPVKNSVLAAGTPVAIVVYEAWRQLDFFGAEVIQSEDL